jgi:hypothetical protein
MLGAEKRTRTARAISQISRLKEALQLFLALPLSVTTVTYWPNNKKPTAFRKKPSPRTPARCPLREAVGSEVGRRDWTRTNDPHHVKVVL